MENTVDTLVGYLPNIVSALIVLVVGTLIAWLLSVLARWAFSKTRLDDKLANWLRGGTARPARTDRWIGWLVFAVAMLFVLMGVFQALDAPTISAPFNELVTTVLGFIPKILGAALLLAVAWVVATVGRLVVTRGLDALRLDERVNRHLPARDASGAAPPDATSGGARTNLAKSLGDAVYWLVFLLFLPMILDVLELEGLLQPLMDMITDVLEFLPNLLLAALILVVGWFVARVIRNVVAGLLEAAGVDRYVQNLGIARDRMRYTLSQMISWIVYILILIPVVIMALEALNVDTITRPAVLMLDEILLAVPRIIAAAFLLVVAWFVGKFVANIVGNLLEGFGFDRMLSNLGLVRSARDEAAQAVPTEARRHFMTMPVRASRVVGYLVLVAIMLFATAEALRLLGFSGLAALVLGLLVFLGNVVLGLIIIAIGLAVARIAAQAVRDSGARDAGLLARIAHIAIVVFAVAMGLQQMGIAASIINLAFGLILGAAAVAAAIAFGIGGRDMAKRQLEKWADRIEEPRSSADLGTGPAQGEIPPPSPPPPV